MKQWVTQGVWSSAEVCGRMSTCTDNRAVSNLLPPCWWHCPGTGLLGGTGTNSPTLISGVNKVPGPQWELGQARIQAEQRHPASQLPTRVPAGPCQPRSVGLSAQYRLTLAWGKEKGFH